MVERNLTFLLFDIQAQDACSPTGNIWNMDEEDSRYKTLISWKQTQIQMNPYVAACQHVHPLNIVSG